MSELSDRTIGDLVRAMQWPDRKVCNMATHPETYCVECHTEAYNAMQETRRRFLAAWVGLTGAPS